MGDRREQASSPVVQGTNEARRYAFDYSKPPGVQISGSPRVSVLDWSTDPTVDRSDDLLSSTDVSVTGTTATMDGVLFDLRDGIEYRLFCRADTTDGQTLETFFRIFGKE